MDEEFENGDGFDEISKAITRQTVDEEFEASGGKLPRYRKPEPSSPVTGPPIKKLKDQRWSDHLEPHEQRDVIRKAKDGDPAAREFLYRCYHKALIKIAGDVKYNGPSFEDRLSAASAGWNDRGGFWRALDGYNLNRNNGFWAYAQKFVIGAVTDFVHDWHQCGGKLETRAEREARKNGQGFRPIYVQYNGIEKRHDEDGADVDGNANGNPITGWITPDDAELRECDGTGGKVTDADWKRIVAGRAVPTNYPPNEYGPQPCKPISRSRYEEDQARAYRFHTAAFVRQRITGWLAPIGRNLGVPRECIGVDENPNRNGGRSPKKIIGSPGFQIPRTSSRCENPLPLREYLKQKPTPKQYLVDASTIRGNGSPLGIIGYLAKDVEARAKQRLAQVGRRLYAQELAVKDRVAIEPLFEPTVQNYCVPVNTAATAITNKVEHIAGPKTLSRCFHDLRDCGWTCKNTMVAKPGVWEERLWHERYAYKNPLWMWKRRTPLDELDDTANVRRRMNALVVAVDNGVENGTIKYNNAVQLGGGVHRADRGDRHDVRTVRRAIGKSSA